MGIKKQERDFEAVKAAFIGKYGGEHHRIGKDLSNLLKLREEQLLERFRDGVIHSGKLYEPQIPIIKDLFNSWK
jgi:hypothetical protein